ncbi:Methylenetetrahydromethanopterin dehydrogenase [Ferroglobus placidus DSM 10642]|uniref:F420-dependent methylenetetrahydromethanopterin dehydrogenase n=1 Tax=Ferroglobus placidus (strain DSM 10642 / AEDII12DO) TaxID=589924 RepID=D3RXG7_FERPA|nr:F420-dependent methylenetetrahydromethanopterin dehydrogenase [Ferroglobus placidus]ADC65180.1 Methylenetetrahydromethanopterin dehydrogenase [Ferroglobus placidus DSM 10642]
MVKVGILKMGAIGTALLVEYLLDERADREDIEVRVVTSGAKMQPEEAKIAEKLKEFDPDLVLVVSPNAALPGPKAAREAFEGKPVIVISDAPAKKAKEEFEQKGFGYILVNADSMIGARREFLDPTEMALFNADVVKVLAATGAFRIVQEEIDKVIEALKKGEKPELPKVVITAERAVEAAKFSNPYAKAKAMAAYFIAEKVADVDVRGCFIEKDPEKYIPLVAAAHEMMRIAAKLADEAREIEKSNDTVFRNPHARDGKILSKTKLMEKPQ